MSESASHIMDCRGIDMNSIGESETDIINGARFHVNWDIDKGSMSIDLCCNHGIWMEECGSKVEGSLRVETGEEGTDHYTKYEFPFVFERNNQSEIIEYKNGKIYRNEQLEEDKKFDQEIFHGFVQYTIVVHRVEGYRILPERKVWDHLSPSCRHDKVVVLDDGTRFFVLSQFLAASSSYFDSLFFNTSFVEAKQEEVAIGGVSKEAFQTMLYFIYPPAKSAEELCRSDLVGELFAVADRFDLPVMMDEVMWWAIEEYWSEHCGHLEMMKWADQYGLLELEDRVSKRLQSANLHQWIHDNHEYFESLPITTREKIYRCFYLHQRKEAPSKAANDFGGSHSSRSRSVSRWSQSLFANLTDHS